MESGWGVAVADKNIEQNSLSVKGHVFSHGIGVHAPGEFIISLYGNARGFKTWVGVDDGAKPYSLEGGTMEFQILADGQTVFESGLMKYGDSARYVNLNLNDVQQLVLMVTDGGDGSHGDHACWGETEITYRRGKAPSPAFSVIATKPYILTPKEPAKPKINGADIYGARPNREIIYKIPATGQKPLNYSATGLPTGLSVDAVTGIISGRVAHVGDYQVNLKVANALGSDCLSFLFRIGDQIALTPPMGFNTWNAWGLNISQQKIKGVIDAFIETGLIDYGWAYINIDDGWAAPQRNKGGILPGNDSFPDIAALADYAHSKGLKLGIYSSPGQTTCGGFPGSLGYEATDAATWAAWGIDYLKYDWCSYRYEAKDNSLEELQKPYILMHECLQKTNRDIVYSLCQYGTGKVWEWGARVGGNLWRTTGDISDSWGAIKNLGIQDLGNAPFAGPGHWNDPDMLIVGQLGWGKDMRLTRLNPDEQYTHITLWSILAAPLLIGCDLSAIDSFTLSLLKNREVIAINQDRLGIQGRLAVSEGKIQFWTKPLSDGTLALAVFNLGWGRQEVAIGNNFTNGKAFSAFNLWTHQTDSPATDKHTITVAPHGCAFYKLTSH